MISLTKQFSKFKTTNDHNLMSLQKQNNHKNKCEKKKKISFKITAYIEYSNVKSVKQNKRRQYNISLLYLLLSLLYLGIDIEYMPFNLQHIIITTKYTTNNTNTTYCNYKYNKKIHHHNHIMI